MPRPPILPDSSTLRNLRRDGWTYQAIADQYGVSVSAVYQQLRDIPGVVAPRARYVNALPWTVAVEHKDSKHAEALRHLARRTAGGTLLPAKDRALDKWLAEREADGCVVDYDRDAGFRLVRRRKSDGDGYVRVRKSKRRP